jgi:hypothetical protein
MLMKKTVFTLLNFLTIFGYSYPETESLKQKNAVTFKENKGQVYDQNNKSRNDILYSGSDGKMVYHLKKDGISYQLKQIESWKKNDMLTHIQPSQEKNESQLIPDKIKFYRLDVNWLHSNMNTLIESNNPIDGFDNYYTNCSKNEIKNVRTFNDITYKNIYNAISLHYYSKDGRLKYDYIVAPGGNYANIQLQISGAKKIRITNSGELVIETPLGEIIEQAPIVIQAGKKLIANWVLKNDIISFNIENINPDLQYIIDPAVRTWGTYYGGVAEDVSRSCSTDKFGNVFMTGWTTTNTLGTTIATSGAYQTTYGGALYDAYLVKFNNYGIRKWGTYYGGAGEDVAQSCCTDLNGNVYIAGSTDTNSIGQISTPSSHQSSYGGGAHDAFLAKFDSTGSRLWVTYYGGNKNEYGYFCATDKSNNVYLTGESESSIGNIIATSNAHQPIFGGGLGSAVDAFLVKFNSNGIRLWGTYYGGSSLDYGLTCTTDRFNNVFMGGYTYSTNGNCIATAGAQQVAFSGCGMDGYFVKFDSTGMRKWGTYYGGNGTESVRSCAADSNGFVNFAGITSSSYNMATPATHQGTLVGTWNAYFARFDSIGQRIWGSYYGGGDEVDVNSICVNRAGDIYLSGTTRSQASQYIATPGSHQPGPGGVYLYKDAFIAKFSTSSQIKWGSYYGGQDDEWGNACAIDNTGHVYLSGNTKSTNAIVTSACHQPINGGGLNDAFLVQFHDCAVNASASSSLVCLNNSVNLYASGATTYSWSNGFNMQNTSAFPIANTNYTVIGGTTYGCTSSAVVSVTVVQLPNIIALSTSSVLCAGQQATLMATGAFTFTWNPGGVGASITVSPNASTQYTISGKGNMNCFNSTVFTQSVAICTNVKDSWENDEEMIKIFPNPFDKEIEIGFLGEVQREIEIYNSVGVLIKKIKSSDSNMKINFENQPKGIYVIKVGKVSKKIIKE